MNVQIDIIQIGQAHPVRQVHDTLARSKFEGSNSQVRTDGFELTSIVHEKARLVRETAARQRVSATRVFAGHLQIHNRLDAASDRN